jgi:hypothetical protein
MSASWSWGQSGEGVSHDMTRRGETADADDADRGLSGRASRGGYWCLSLALHLGVISAAPGRHDGHTPCVLDVRASRSGRVCEIGGLDTGDMWCAAHRRTGKAWPSSMGE